MWQFSNKRDWIINCFYFLFAAWTYQPWVPWGPVVRQTVTLFSGLLSISLWMVRTSDGDDLTEWLATTPTSWFGKLIDCLYQHIDGMWTCRGIVVQSLASQSIEGFESQPDTNVFWKAIKFKFAPPPPLHPSVNGYLVVAGITAWTYMREQLWCWYDFPWEVKVMIV